LRNWNAVQNFESIERRESQSPIISKSHR